MDKDMSLIISNKSIKIPPFYKMLLLVFIIIFIYLLLTKISLYDVYDARIVRMEDEYYAQVLVPLNNQVFIQNNIFLVDHKEYKYKIYNIEENYVSYNNVNYMLVNVISNLDESYNIENNYLKIKQKRKKDTLFNIILEKIKEGMNL